MSEGFEIVNQLRHIADVVWEATRQQKLDWRPPHGEQESPGAFIAQTPRGSLFLATGVGEGEAGLMLRISHGAEDLGCLTLKDFPALSELWVTVSQQYLMSSAAYREKGKKIKQIAEDIEQLAEDDLLEEHPDGLPPSHSRVEGSDEDKDSEEDVSGAVVELGDENRSLAADPEEAFQQQMDETGAAMIEDVAGPAAAEEFLSLPGDEGQPSRPPREPPLSPLPLPPAQVVRRGGMPPPHISQRDQG